MFVLRNPLNVSVSTIERNIKKLKDKCIIERRGTDKSGYRIIKDDVLNDGVNDGLNNNIEERILNKLKFDNTTTKESLARSLNYLLVPLKEI